jgi:hypothetical protein
MMIPGICRRIINHCIATFGPVIQQLRRPVKLSECISTSHDEVLGSGCKASAMFEMEI